MIAMRSFSFARVAGFLLMGSLGCGLISSDITRVTFDLPAKTYSFNSAQWGIPAGNTVAVPCGGASPVQDCCNPPAPLPKPNCTANPIVCEASVCTLKQPVTVAQKMDLKMEVPQLSSVSNQSVVDISLTSLHYDAVSTLNVDVPALELFLADDGVMSATDASAMKFGTVPSIPKGTSPSGDVVLEPNADALFAARGHMFGTPFNFIATTTISVPSGSPTPNGAITVTVTGKAAAKL